MIRFESTIIVLILYVLLSPIAISTIQLNNVEHIDQCSDTLDPYPPWNCEEFISDVKFCLKFDPRIRSDNPDIDSVLVDGRIPFTAIDVRVLAWYSLRRISSVSRDLDTTMFSDTTFSTEALVWVHYVDSVRQKPWWVILHMEGPGNQDLISNRHHDLISKWTLDRWNIWLTVGENIPHLPIGSYAHAPTNSDMRVLLAKDSSLRHIQDIDRSLDTSSKTHTIVFLDGAVRSNTWKAVIGDEPWWIYPNREQSHQ